MKTKKTNEIIKKLNILLVIVLLANLIIAPATYASHINNQIHIDEQPNNQNDQTQVQQSTQVNQNLDTHQDQLTTIPSTQNTVNQTNNNTVSNSTTNTFFNEISNNTIATPIFSAEQVEVGSPVTNEFPAVDDPLEIHADSCILIEQSTGRILYEKNSSQKIFPASTTKLMTALLTTEFVDDLNEKALVSYYAVKSIPETYSIANLQPGEQISVSDLLNSLLVGSANDSAYVLAQYIINRGNNFPYDDSENARINFENSIKQFSELMNRKAKELGCQNSYFKNPNGIHNDYHYSTAIDLAIIGQAAYNNQTIREISTKLEYTLQDSNIYRPTPRTMKQTNNLLYQDKSSYYEFANGLKTGYTEAAEYCIVASSSRDGFDLIAVVLHSDNISDDNISREADCKKLFEYGYNNFQKTKIAEKDSVITTLNIRNGSKTISELNLLSNKEVIAILKNKDIYNLTPEITINKSQAPIKKGEVIGTATYTIEGATYTTNLVAEHAVSVNTYSTIIFIAIGVFFIIAIVAIVLTGVILKDE